MSDVDELCINTLRFLSVDAVEQAHSGHPGMPLGAAPMAYVLWDRFLRYNPRDPAWPDRDRFILSAGHGSALLYSLLHMTGYDLPLQELRDFRQWGSRTPGHPERGDTPGVEVTTGPLGQGFGMGVGMAMAERFLAGYFNEANHEIIDHYTYAIVSDGDLMEGVASEAASLAGMLGLGKLIYLYDDNDISIEGHTALAFTEDVAGRFGAYGWQVCSVEDGNDVGAIEAAIGAAQAERERPSLIIVRTHIGYGSPKQDMAEAHGEPLGAEAAAETKRRLGWPLEPTFHIPDEARSHMGKAVQRGAELRAEWQERLNAYRGAHPDKAAELERAMSGELPAGWDSDVPVFAPDDGPMATREASGKVLNSLAKRLPTLIGGSADLAPSTKTLLAGCEDFHQRGPSARNIHFGVREHAMGTIVNGMALHGGVIPYGATFLVFSDYMRPSLRLAAMMGARSIFVFTHDSIGVGEDGPTHQPIEHVMSLRAIPGLTVLRPADPNETAAAWRVAIERDGPVAFALTRQKVPVLDAEAHDVANGVRRGAYVVADAEAERPEVLLIATGSEVHLALAAREELAAKGIHARAVSMPSWELFDEQTAKYRDRVLPPGVPKLAIEAGTARGWGDYVGSEGDVIGLRRFGASAPGALVMEKLGFSVANVVQRALALVAE
jgi:transketolase